jgi:hypothetical protein
MRAEPMREHRVEGARLEHVVDGGEPRQHVQVEVLLDLARVALAEVAARDLVVEVLLEAVD